MQKFVTLLLMSAPALDVTGKILELPALFTTAWYLLPVALSAWAIAVVVHLLDPLSRASTGHPSSKVKLLRAAMGTAGVLLLLLAWWLRGEPELEPENALVAFELVAAVLLLWSLHRTATAPASGITAVAISNRLAE